jgi:formylglycine-generating enzyme required for sulfatase activity
MASGKSNLFIQKSRHIGPRIARQPSRAIALNLDSLAAYPPPRHRRRAPEPRRRGGQGASWYTRMDRHRPSFRGADPENTASHQFGFRMARTL